MKKFFSRFTVTAVAALAFAATPTFAQDNTKTIPRPDGKPADMTRVAKALGEAATGKTQPAGEELPKDTNTIESLTPEQAKKLAAEFPGVDVEIKSRTGRKSTFRGALPLNGLKTIDAETAESLLSDKEEELCAKYLFRDDINGAILLNGLTKLTADEAQSLAKFNADLTLGGLTTLSVEAAQSLAESMGQVLLLRGVTTLSAEAAKALAAFKGRALFLTGLTKLSVDTARLVIRLGDLKPEGDNQILPKLTALDVPDAVEIATILATAKRRLNLPNLKRISQKTLKVLTANGNIEIPPTEKLELIPDEVK